jgi:hypothetical protein
MRGLIARLRNMPVADPAFDETFFTLMRHVMHHVADEETQLLPAAERLLPQQLAGLGAQMTRRRLELTGPRAPELASSLARSLAAEPWRGSAAPCSAGAYLLDRHQHGDRLTATREPVHPADLIRDQGLAGRT